MNFFKKNKPPLLNSYERLIINKFRLISKNNNSYPSIKITDEEIMYVYNTVSTSFKVLSRIYDNELPIGIINYLALFHLNFYENGGDTSFKSHLRFEIQKGIECSFSIQHQYQQINII